MPKLYKSGEVSGTLNLRQSTLREWRMNDCDFALPKVGNQVKDYRYSKQGLLALSIMQEGRVSGAPVDRSWSLAFWSVVEVAKWLKLPDLEEYDLHGPISDGINRYAIIPPSSENPIITSDIRKIDYVLGSGDNGNSSMVFVFHLEALANRLPERLKAELRS